MALRYPASRKPGVSIRGTRPAEQSRALLKGTASPLRLADVEASTDVSDPAVSEPLARHSI